MIIGTFKYDPEADIYDGHLRTLAMCVGLSVRPNADVSGTEPAYRIIADGSAAEVGAAWVRKQANGRKFLSVSIDDPVLPYPIYAALFMNEEGLVGTLVWNRPKSGTKIVPKAPAKAQI
jgi:uncharacterized protein (DUF736 family)